MEKKNAAIIGYGGMGSWHGEYLRHSDVVNLMGVYDIKPERCEAAEKNGIHAYSSLKALLSDPAVDFVTIAVPNDMHKPLAIEAMKAGKHVISEKPVTLSSADLQEMFDASDKYHRLFTVHQNRRWDGEFLLMRDIYHSGDLGQVYRMESRVHGSRGIPGDWRGTPEHGGGMILDWGIHLIDQIMGIVDDKTLRKVFCHCDHITNELVDDGFQLDMFFDDDLVARVEVGTSNFISMPRFYMTGADGSAIIPGASPRTLSGAITTTKRTLSPSRRRRASPRPWRPATKNPLRPRIFPSPLRMCTISTATLSVPSAARRSRS